MIDDGRFNGNLIQFGFNEEKNVSLPTIAATGKVTMGAFRRKNAITK